jgi:hypothetical protein
MALSRSFPDLPSAVAGIAAVREYAGMGLVTEIAAPQNDGLRQSVADNVPADPKVQNRGRDRHTKEPRARAGTARDRAHRSPVRPPRIGIPSAARFLGGRAVIRNQQLIVRWRQALETRTAQVGFSSC